MDDEIVLLEDGCHYLVLNGNYPVDRAPGFLLRRRGSGPAAVGIDCDCVGAFRQRDDGRWEAEIEAGPGLGNEDGEFVIGNWELRLDAIHALWGARARLAPNSRHERH